MHAAPKRLFTPVLKISKLRAKLSSGHVHQRQHVAVLLALHRASPAFEHHIQTRTIKTVTSISNRQNFVLWLAPFKADKRATASGCSGNVKHDSAESLGVT